MSSDDMSWIGPKTTDDMTCRRRVWHVVPTCRPTLHDVAKGKGCRMLRHWRFHDMSMTYHFHKRSELSQMVSELWHHIYISMVTRASLVPNNNNQQLTEETNTTQKTQRMASQEMDTNKGNQNNTCENWYHNNEHTTVIPRNTNNKLDI